MPRASVPNYISGTKPENYKLTLPDAEFVLEEYRGKVFPLTQALAVELPSMLDDSKAGFNAFMLAIEAFTQEQIIAGRTETTTPETTTPETGTMVDTNGDGIPDFDLLYTPEEPAKAEDPAVSTAKGFYLSLWGVSPPKGYVEGFFKAGGDVFDFQRQELGRPGAESKPYFRDRAVSFAATLSDVFGRGF